MPQFIGVKGYDQYWINPITEVFTPTFQDIANVNVSKADVFAITRGNKCTNFERYMDVSALLTFNFTQGGFGWTRHDLAHLLYIKNNNSTAPLYDPSTPEWKPEIQNIDLNKTGQKSASKHKNYHPVYWARMKNYQYFEQTLTIEKFTPNPIARTTKTTAEKVYGLLGVLDTGTTRKATIKELEKKVNKKDVKTIKEFNNLKKKHAKDIKEKIDVNIPMFPLTDENVSSVLDLSSIRYYDATDVVQRFANRLTTSAQNINMTEWDYKYIHCVPADVLENHFPNETDDDVETNTKVFNWDWLTVDKDEEENKLSTIEVNRQMQLLSDRFMITNMYYISKLDIHASSEADKFLQYQLGILVL